jgi:hypothetical protein
MIIKPMTWPGGELALNYCSRLEPDSRLAQLGEMAVEVQTPEGRTVESSVLSDCTLAPKDSAFSADCFQTVTWNKLHR